jgi:hypothetical protein
MPSWPCQLRPLYIDKSLLFLFERHITFCILVTINYSSIYHHIRLQFVLHLLNCRSPNKNLKLKFPSFLIFYKDQPRVLVIQNLVDLLQSRIHEHYYASLRSVVSPSVYGPHPESHVQELSSTELSIVHGSGGTTEEALGLPKKKQPRLRYCRTRNNGTSGAQNRALI